MPETYLISDTHFGHAKILEYEPLRRELGSTVDEHDETLVQRWNGVVRDKDTVWHLGDVLFGVESFETVARLRGLKKLVMGNHDVYRAKRYLEVFDDIKAIHELDRMALTHVPLHESQKRRWRSNIHGHLHNKHMPDPWYVNVSCEVIRFQPVPLYVVKQNLKDAGVI